MQPGGLTRGPDVIHQLFIQLADFGAFNVFSPVVTHHIRGVNVPAIIPGEYKPRLADVNDISALADPM